MGSQVDGYLDVILQKPVADLCQVGGFTHAVDAHKHNGVRLATCLRCIHLSRAAHVVSYGVLRHVQKV